MIRFACPNCRVSLSTRPGLAGKVVPCPKCGQRMQVPHLGRAGGSQENPHQRLMSTGAAKGQRPSRRPLLAGVLAGSLLVCACAGGAIWALAAWLDDKTPSVVSVVDPPAMLPPHESEPSKEKPSIPVKPPEENKPPREKPSKPVQPPPSLSPPEPKEIALADDLPPELEFQLVDAVNVQRRKAGLEPIFLDNESSRGCQQHAGYLARNAARLTGAETEWHEEKDTWPGASDLGRASARRAAVAAAEPLAAIEKWLNDPARRAPILEPRLRRFAAGFARNVEGGWFSVFDWTAGVDRQPAETTGLSDAIAVPAPGQSRVPLWFPGNEIPDPLPQATHKLAGYPLTLTFPPQTRVDSVTGRLREKGTREVEIWLSSPEKPANPKFASAQQNTICLIAKQPLKPGMRYRIEMTANVDGQPRSGKWSFTTMSAGEIHHEMAGRLLRTLNEHRRQAGLRPVGLDSERSLVCTAHARYLGANAPNDPNLNWNEEKPNLPGYTDEGAALARTASIQGGGGPVEAVNGLVDSLISRPRLLDPHLYALGLGYTPFARGGWIWVMDLQQRGGEKDDVAELLYPAPEQKNVPLTYPPDEVPSPIPAESKGRAGYAISAEFPIGAKLQAASGKLTDDKGEEVAVWLSTPAEPAIPGFRQHFLCLLPRAPLKPGLRYTATFAAELAGQPWKRAWSFTTLPEPNRFTDNLDQKLLARLNALRAAARLPVVRLDESLSRGCQAHANYLALNAKSTAGQSLDVHDEDATLPGATTEGARAAKGAVIAVVLDPLTCMDGWMSTLYHRIPLLAPNLERVGFGHARVGGRKWACVLDAANGRDARKQPENTPNGR